MKFIIKLFPEITIKSQSVRLRFIKILASNILNILKILDNEIYIIRHWDNIEVYTKKNIYHDEISDALTKIPGIHHVFLVKEYQFQDLNNIFELASEIYAKQIINKTFCVRVKRRGKHNFTSIEVERYIGSCLNKQVLSAKVKLSQPDITLNFEIIENKVIFIKSRIQGIGGFPIGTQEDVLSLISGGFDSSVSSYMLIRRGCRVHYCFFNLSGTSHDINVKQICYHLWYRFGRSHKVRFIIIDFIPIIKEIIEKIDDNQMGVILKRMMIRVASKIAEHYNIEALVTGEALGQVSSQTLTNLRLINNVTDKLILRPLISHDKENIINIAREIGTEYFSRTMPEFCGLISKKPTVKAVKEKIEEQEINFNFSLLDRVISTVQNIDIRQIIYHNQNKISKIEIVNIFSPDDIILDIRCPYEQITHPLRLSGVKVKLLPFYKLNSQFSKLPFKKHYLLYCDRGIMSRLQALYLYEQGFKNIKVYRPLNK
ncbi:MAG: tRNA uracil 4-sulfurtransferase ThiI [Arsenophonus sp. ET-YP4-MAG3]